jgi:hypothetical protein
VPYGPDVAMLMRACKGAHWNPTSKVGLYRLTARTQAVRSALRHFYEVPLRMAAPGARRLRTTNHIIWKLHHKPTGILLQIIVPSVTLLGCPNSNFCLTTR